MVIAQGDVWWADLPDPLGSEPGFRRPVVVVQGDSFNRSAIRTVVCIPLTTNTARLGIPGHAELPARETGLAKASVALCTQPTAVDRRRLVERVGRLSAARLELVLSGIDITLGR